MQLFFLFCFLSCLRKWKSRTMSKLVVFPSKLHLLIWIVLLEDNHLLFDIVSVTSSNVLWILVKMLCSIFGSASETIAHLLISWIFDSTSIIKPLLISTNWSLIDFYPTPLGHSFTHRTCTSSLFSCCPAARPGLPSLSSSSPACFLMSSRKSFTGTCTQPARRNLRWVSDFKHKHSEMEWEMRVLCHVCNFAIFMLSKLTLMK